jgi:tryptophanyl-tRNA synthetase
MKQIIVSGMRPTGKLHLGHYLGVIQNWVELQDKYECYFFAADWHALTTKYDKTDELRQNTLDVVMDWLACGIDPEKSTIYVQSLVPEIAELNIYLGMITPQNWVERDPTLKDMAKILKTKEGQNSQINYGLMGYPVLMSSDIMMFNADCVPVGIDQVAHIEITRDIARRFNNLYGEFFHEAKPLLNNCSLICGLDGNKMGKSFNNDIKISDTSEVTSKKVMSAITDRSRLRKDDLGHPDECEVAFKYWKIFGSEEEVQTVRCECEKGLRGCAQCKRQLGDKINSKLEEIRERRKYYEQNPQEVEKIIQEGSTKARKKAQEVLKEVRKLVKMY